MKRKIGKKLISMLLALFMLFSVLPAGAITASAAEFTIRSTAPAKDNKYYYSSINPFYSSGYSGQCTWYSYGRAYEILGKKPNLSLSDAKNWYTYNKNNGYYKYGQTPKVGAIVCWANGTHGHVGVVEKVISNTNVYISEANVDGGNWRYRNYNPATWNSNFQGYIYLLDGISPDPHPPCTFTGSYFESAHPHKVYQKCSCGKTKYTGATTAYHNCSTCMKLSTAYVMPVKAYTINTGKTTVYSSVNGTAKSNKIYDTDLCTISQIYDCGWCKVSFPLDAGGTETGYCKISTFMKGGGFQIYTSKQINTYRRSDLKTANGYAGAGDKIYILGTDSSATQIAYPLSAGGWKVGWIPTSAIKSTISYNSNGGSGSMANSSVQYKNTITLAANKFSKTGYTFSGWNAYRSSDKTWYVSGQGWLTASQISSKGYSKKLYSNQAKYTLDMSWLHFGKTNDTFTFYAVWTPNKLTVNYNANGGTIRSDTYKLSNNLVYKKSNNTILSQTWTYNESKKDGLYNASTFGLARTGYKFKGWGTTASGSTVFDQNDGTLVPTSINSAIKNGNCSSTLYAIWEPIHTHNYTVIKTNPTCTEGGYTTYKCSCGDSYVGNYTSATGHSYDNGKVTKAATCTANGTKTFTCTTCGATKTETIQATGHTVVTDKAVAPTCTKSGKTAGSHCSVCNTVITAQKTVAATGHSYDAGKITQAATATTNGIKIYTCTACGETKTEIIPATGLKAPTANYTVNSDRTFTISWNAVKEADKYEVYSSNDGGATYNLKAETSDLSIKTNKAVFGKTYKYKVRALKNNNDAVTSDFSDVVNAVNDKYLPDPTAKYTVNADRTFTISWNQLTGADKYEIYSYNASTGTYKYVKTTTELSHKTGKAAFGTTYKYKIRAVNSANNVKSGYCTVSAVNNKYLPVPAVKYAVNSDCTLTLSWAKVTGADKYEIYSYNASTGTYKYVKTTTELSHKTGKASYDVIYKYKIRAVNSENNIKSAYCTVNAVNNKKLTTPTAKLAVNTNGTFTISWGKVTGATKYEVYIFDSSIGDYRLSRTTTGTSITTSTAAKGKTYFYKVRAVTSQNTSATSDFSAVVKGTR